MNPSLLYGVVAARVACSPCALHFDSFALLAWCILSSCMGRPILSAMSELWEMLTLGARSSGGAAHARRRMNPTASWEDDELFELEYRGRSRVQ